MTEESLTLAITPELRREALTEAAASLRLEGLAFSEANDDLREAWIDGRMTGEEVRQGIIARAVEAQQVRDKGH